MNPYEKRAAELIPEVGESRAIYVGNYGATLPGSLSDARKLADLLRAVLAESLCHADALLLASLQRKPEAAESKRPVPVVDWETAKHEAFRRWKGPGFAWCSDGQHWVGLHVGRNHFPLGVGDTYALAFADCDRRARDGEQAPACERPMAGQATAPNRFFCGMCVSIVIVDEDGCCKTCGNDTQPVHVKFAHGTASASRTDAAPAELHTGSTAPVAPRLECIRCGQEVRDGDQHGPGRCLPPVESMNILPSVFAVKERVPVVVGVSEAMYDAWQACNGASALGSLTATVDVSVLRILCREIQRLSGDIAERTRELAGVRAAYEGRWNERNALVRYIDEAKAALGEDRVTGQPLADAIRELRERAEKAEPEARNDAPALRRAIVVAATILEAPGRHESERIADARAVLDAVLKETT